MVTLNVFVTVLCFFMFYLGCSVLVVLV